MNRRTLPTLLAGLVVAVASENPTTAQDDPPPSVAWVKSHAHPFDTVVAGHGFDDISFLSKSIGDARVVALGEATHGTREHFQMKHRLLEYLATNMGFNVFAIEANMPESYRVDRYVTGGSGDPASLIGGMYFWTWNTQEVLDMVKWMRAFNEREEAAKSGRHVRFAGFDMQLPAYPQTLVRRFVEKHDAEFLPELDGLWKSVSEERPDRGGDFGVTNAFLPVQGVRGRKVRISGCVRTEDLKDGWAGLWLRIDTAAEPNKLLDNMEDRGSKGTTDWTPCSVEFDVPKDASCVVFGTIFVGSGRAWFDSLQIEVDGKKDDSLLADPSFETTELGPFPRAYACAGGPSDEIGAVEGVAKDGKRSLLMRRGVGIPRVGGEEAAKAALTHLTDARQRYVAAGVPAADADWAIQNARLVVQAMTLYAAGGDNGARDESMAANVRWILDQDPKAKVVLWAHNFHVSGTAPWMGSHLKKALGTSYVDVGFMAGSGTYYAMDEAGARVHKLQEPIEGSVEWIFRNAGMPRAILDLRNADYTEPGSEWAQRPCKFGGTIGAARMDERFMDVDPHEAFDVLVYVDQTTAARQLPTPPATEPPKD